MEYDTKRMEILHVQYTLRFILYLQYKLKQKILQCLTGYN